MELTSSSQCMKLISPEKSIITFDHLRIKTLLPAYPYTQVMENKAYLTTSPEKPAITFDHLRIKTLLPAYPYTQVMENKAYLTTSPEKPAIPFDHLPIETIRHIFSYYVCGNDSAYMPGAPLLDRFCKLNRVCKKFQQAIEFKTIGTIFQHCNEVLNILILAPTILKNENAAISAIDPAFYLSKRKIALGLLCSSTKLDNESRKYILQSAMKDNELGKLLYSAMEYDDRELIEFLCHEKHIDIPETYWDGVPVFFWARTVQMTQLCQSNGMKLDATPLLGQSFPNILWPAITHDSIPSTMVEFYLQQNIPIQPRDLDGRSLLHQLAGCCGSAKVNINNMLHKGELLLAKQPLLINALDNASKTPLDYAEQALSLNRESALKLITFLKEKDGMTSKELLPQKISNDSCIIS